jgi:hypothetical protein
MILLIPTHKQTVSLETVKSHLKLNPQDTSEDKSLTRFIAAATTTIEQYLRRCLLAQLVIEVVPAKKFLPTSTQGLGRNPHRHTPHFIPREPLQSLGHLYLVKADDKRTPNDNPCLNHLSQNGWTMTHTLDPAHITRHVYGGRHELRPLPALQSRLASLDHAIHVALCYVVGYDDNRHIPAPIQNALLTHVAKLYEHRSDGTMPHPCVDYPALKPYKLMEPLL